MRHIFTLLLTCSLLSATLSANNRVEITIPDMEQIKAATYDPHSAYYYLTLYQRYTDNDTTLGLEEYRHLYLGYAYQEGYNPYFVSTYNKILNQLPTEGDSISTEQNDSILKYATLAVDDQPFNLRYINLLIYSYQHSGNTTQAKVWSDKLNHLAEAILSTGDGLTPQSAWYVIYPQHEYEVINLMGLTTIGQLFVQERYDFITVDKNVLDIDGYYFDVTTMLSEYKRKFD